MVLINHLTAILTCANMITRLVDCLATDNYSSSLRRGLNRSLPLITLRGITSKEPDLAPLKQELQELAE